MKWPALPPSCAQTLRANRTPSRIRVTPWMSPLWGESAWREPCPMRWVREGGAGRRLAGARRLPLDERLRLRALAFAMPLDLHDRRDDDRPTLGALLEQVGGGLAHLLLEDHRVDHAVGGHPVERVEHPDAGLLDEVARLRLVDEAAGDDVGAGEHLAALRLDGDHDVDEALAAELAAVAQDGVADVADAETVDEHHPGGDALGPLQLAAVQLDHVAVLADDHVVAGDAGGLGQARRLGQVA